MREDFPRDIIMFSTADWNNPFWTNKQHMASRMAGRGFRILYIESLGLRKPSVGSRDTTRIFRRIKMGLSGLREVQENLWVYSPLVIPAHGISWVNQLNNKILMYYIRSYVRRLGFQDPMFWTYNPLTVELTGRVGESMIVYHCVDDLTASPGVPVKILASAEERLLQKADIVFTTSPQLQVSRSVYNPGNTYYLPNVADFDHFSKALLPGHIPEELAKIPKPRIGFIGAISNYKIDFELIAHIAEARQEWQWVMIGEVGEGQPETSIDKLRRPNIHFLGHRSYQALPDYLRGIDVAVLPNRLNKYTTSMFPMKFFEYLSAGKPVIATDLPALHDYSDACTLTKSPEEFIQAIADALKNKVTNINYGLTLAKQHTWEKRLDKMERILNNKWKEK